MGTTDLLDKSTAGGSGDFVSLTGRNRQLRRLMTSQQSAGSILLIDQQVRRDAGLYRSVDSGTRSVHVASDVTVTALAFGKSPPDRNHPTLFAIGTRGDLRAT